MYVSYDGAGEPLGRSQVVAYLQRLARDCDITLISFEKDRVSRVETEQLLHDAGIAWRPLTYHKRPPALSTLGDVLTGAAVIRRVCRAFRPDVVHVRSDVPALMAMLASSHQTRAWKLLFDIRGFWADERVAGGLWRSGGVLHSLAKRCERWFFAEADAVVTLTAASVPQIRRWLGARDVPVAVIPTCAEIERFRRAQPRADGPHAVWCGSIGTFYRFDLAVRFADALAMPLTVLTRHLHAARSQLGDREADVREVAPERIADALFPGDVGMCFYVTSSANLARAPTRLAEYLAAGAVVAATPGIGDLEAILRRGRVGVLVDDESEAGLAHAADQARALARDPAASERARRQATQLFSIERGALAYLDLYRMLARPPAASR